MNDFTPKSIDLTKNHLKMLGKEPDGKMAIELLNALVKYNPNFPRQESADVILDAFYNAIHYGSLELRNSTLVAHTRAFSEWIKGRTNIRPVQNYHSVPPKPDNWQYDPNEPLPPEITKKKAKQLMDIIAKLYEGELDRVINNSNFMHYVNKLKARYYE
jgi:hypothetical protein